MKRKKRSIDDLKTSGKKTWFPLLAFALIFAVLVLSYLAVDGYRFVRDLKYWQRNRKLRQQYLVEVGKLQEEQRLLEEEIDRLKNNSLAQERVAREMGYIKQGEAVYKFVQRQENDAD